MRHELETVVDGLVFAEGLRWHEGRLWYSDMHAGEVHTWSAAAGLEVVLRREQALSGLGWTPGGDLLVVSMDDRRLLRSSGGRIDVVADLAAETAAPLNDMVVDRHGLAYIGSFGFDLFGGEPLRPSVVFAVEPSGRHRAAADDLLFPNGMVITDGGRTLVVAETMAGRLTAFSRRADGSLHERRPWAQLPEGVAPDGICLDADGAVWAASASTSECLRVVEGGEVLDRVAVGSRLAIACTLGGHDGRTLFVATSGHPAPEDARRHRDGRIEATAVEVGMPDPDPA